MRVHMYLKIHSRTHKAIAKSNIYGHHLPIVPNELCSKSTNAGQWSRMECRLSYGATAEALGHTPVWPSKIITQSPVSTLHILAVLSAEHEASHLPQGENRTQTTPRVWPTRFLLSLHGYQNLPSIEKCDNTISGMTLRQTPEPLDAYKLISFRFPRSQHCTAGRAITKLIQYKNQDTYGRLSGDGVGRARCTMRSMPETRHRR